MAGDEQTDSPCAEDNLRMSQLVFGSAAFDIERSAHDQLGRSELM
jgi:hypothetical protein